MDIHTQNLERSNQAEQVSNEEKKDSPCKASTIAEDQIQIEPTELESSMVAVPSAEEEEEDPLPSIDRSKLLSGLQRILRHRTRFCKHSEHSCLKNAVTTFLGLFAKGYLIKCGLSLLLLLAKQRTRAFKHLASVLGTDSLRFASFVSLFSALFPLVQCLLRTVRGKEDGLNAALAGAVASLSVLLDDRERRSHLVPFIFVRSLWFGLNGLDRNKVVKKVPKGEVITLSFVGVCMFYFFVCEHDIAPPGGDKLMWPASCPKRNDYIIRDIYRELTRIAWEKAHGSKP